MDIVILAMVAGFIALRLYSVLGRRTGNEHQQESPPYGMRGSADQAAESAGDNQQTGEQAAPAPTVDIAAGSELDRMISRIEVADRRFERTQFVAGAGMAYEMIIEAFAAGDRDTLRPLLSDDVYESFDAAITAREDAGQEAETKLIELLSVDIVGAELDGNMAEIDVRLRAEVLSAIRDSEGRVIDGNPSDPETIVDVWTFQRETKSRDPNWLLVATERESG